MHHEVAIAECFCMLDGGHGIVIWNFLLRDMTMAQKTKNHYDVIDILKALSALIVIWLHVSDHYKSSPFINSIWVWSHFAVGAFVISSGFLQGIKPFVLENVRAGFKWLWKRAKRLVGPYYVFFAVYAVLILIAPSVFNGRPFELNLDFILSSVLLDGGLGGNWIPRVFVLMSALHLIFELLTQRFGAKKYYFPLVLSLVVSLWFFIDEPDVMQKYIQVFTWYSLFIFGILLFKNRKKRAFVWGSLTVSALVTVACGLYLLSSGQSISIFSHKYPPTLYFVGYNTFITLLLYIVSPKSLPRIMKPLVIWMSRKSYEIFFVHLIVIDALSTLRFTLVIDFILTAGITLLTVYIWEKLFSSINSRSIK